MSGAIFSCHEYGGGKCYEYVACRGRDAAKNATMHRMAKNDQAQSVDSAEAEKSYYTSKLKQEKKGSHLMLNDNLKKR